MRILHICVAGPYTDGWNYQENMLTKYHAKAGHDVSLLASQWMWGDNGKIKKIIKTEYINNDGVKIYRLPIRGGKDVFYHYKRFKGFYKTIVNIEPDIIFVHNLQFFDVDQIIKYAKQHKVKLYADNHADFSNSARSRLTKLFYKIVWRYFAQKIEPYVKKFYGVLPSRVDFLIDIYKLPKEKCELLVMGADDDKVEEVSANNSRNNIREKYGIQKDDLLIMTGGKIDIWKTQTLLLMEAVSKMSNDKVKLIVFGSIVPELKSKVAELADGKKVQYIGWVQSDQSYKYWSAADLAVFPGRHSVFWEQVVGMGIPMVCKYWDGVVHVDIGGNIKFLKEDSVEEIIRVIEGLFNMPEEYKKMLQVAKEKGRECFWYKNIAKRAIEE